MNTLKTISCIVALASAVGLSAQTKEIAHDFSRFNSISVTDGFEVSLIKGSNYSAVVYVDAPLAEYVETYVRGRILHINFNEKAVPKETKKLYKGKNGLPATFRATVYVPDLESIELTDNAVLIAAEEFEAPRLDIKLTDKAKIKTLKVRCNSADINMKKQSEATLNIVADNKLNIITEGSTTLAVTGSAGEFLVDAEGSSTISADVQANSTLVVGASGSATAKVKSDAQQAKVFFSKSAKITLSGSANSAIFKGSKSAQADASDFTLAVADVDLSGVAKANVNVSEELSVTLTDGSALYFIGNPKFQVSKIIRSTLAPYGTK